MLSFIYKYSFSYCWSIRSNVKMHDYLLFFMTQFVYCSICSFISQLSEAMVKAQKEIEDINLQLSECKTRLVFLKKKSY